MDSLSAIALGEKTLASTRWSTSQAPSNWVKYAELSGRKVYDGEEIVNIWDAQEYPGWYKRQGSIAPNETELYAEFTSEEGEQTEFWVKNGNTWSYTFNVYDDTVPYWVWEDPVEGFSSEQTVPFKIEPDETGKLPAVVTILNTRQDEAGSISVTKIADDNGRFQFNVLLQGDGITGVQKFGDVTVNNGLGYFFLSNGETMTLTDVPVGTNFLIQEDAPGYNVSWSAEPAGTITANGESLSFTCNNTLIPPPPPPPPPSTLDVHVTKAVTGSYTYANEFGFNAVFKSLYAGETYNYNVNGESLSFTADGSGTAYVAFKLTDGATADFYELPAGATYQFVEDGGDWKPSYTVTDANGFTAISSSSGAGTVGNPLSTAAETADSGEDITVAFTNVLEKMADIHISKIVSVPDGEDIPDDSFTVNAVFDGLTPGAYYNTDIGTIRADVDGHAERQFGIKAGEDFWFYGLPVGATYRFTEEASPYIASFTVTDANGGTSVVTAAGANEKSRTELATATETVDEDETVGVTFTNVSVPLRDIEVRKEWKDAEDQDGIRPKSIDVQLLADDRPVGNPVTLTKAMGWRFTWTDLDVYNDNGQEIVYAVQEIAVRGYEVNPGGDVESGFVITNTHSPETIDVDGEKQWFDEENQDGLRPDSITVRLHADGTEIASATATKDSNWSYSFTDLPKYRDGGIEIKYTVTEDAVEGYTAEIEGFVIKNTHTTELTKVEGRKIWDDDDNRDAIRPESVTVRLKADGREVASAEVSEKTDWAYSFVDLPKYRDGGVEIKYTVTEDAVSGYTPVLDKYNITNRYTPGITSVTVTKVWDDDYNRDGKRPAEIEVQLLADGKNSGNPVKLSSANDWTYTWTGLPEKDAGKTIAYTVREIAVRGYTVSLSGDAKRGFVFTNSYTPVTVKVEGSKTWKDADNAAGARPYSITVGLFADGRLVASRTVTNENNWKWSFTDLPKYRDGGVEIVYTVVEQAVPNYKATVKGYNITNTYDPPSPPPGSPPQYPSNTPRTGDDSHIGAWLIPFVLSGAALVTGGAVLLRKKKKQKPGKHI